MAAKCLHGVNDDRLRCVQVPDHHLYGNELALSMVPPRPCLPQSHARQAEVKHSIPRREATDGSLAKQPWVGGWICRLKLLRGKRGSRESGCLAGEKKTPSALEQQNIHGGRALGDKLDQGVSSSSQ